MSEEDDLRRAARVTYDAEESIHDELVLRDRLLLLIAHADRELLLFFASCLLRHNSGRSAAQEDTSGTT